jgi:hypothetical protein
VKAGTGHLAAFRFQLAGALTGSDRVKGSRNQLGSLTQNLGLMD